MFDWFTELAAKEKATFWACFAGWTLDAMDVQFYGFVIPALIATWHITTGQAGVLATSSLLLSAFGGWLAGMLADRVGRVRTLQITILWYSLFTFLSGLCQNYGQLIAARGLMGLGFGGEWAAGAVLMGEMIRAEHRGKAVGAVQSGWAVGWGISNMLFAILFSVLPEAAAWRVLFIVGVAPGAMVFFIRRHVPEPQVFEATRRRIAEGAARPHFSDIFAADVVRTTILTALLATGCQGAYYAITNWLPTYLKTVHHLSVLNTSGYLAVVIIGSFIGYLAGAYLTDVIGRRRHFFIFSICSFLTVVVYMTVTITDTLMLVLGFPLGFFASGIFSAVGAYFTELFPSRVRGSGQGFADNFGRGIGALFPALVGYLGQSMGLGLAIGIFAALAYALVLVTALFLPETRGKELSAYS
jgi:MFS family permease